MNARTTRRTHGVDAIGRGIWRLWRVQCVACLLIGLALLAALGPRIAHADATATTVTVYPSDDATVRSWEPDQALGQDDYLELSYWSIDVPKGEYVLVRFDVATALPADAIIDSAQMEFYVVDALSPSTAPSATTWAWT